MIAYDTIEYDMRGIVAYLIRNDLLLLYLYTFYFTIFIEYIMLDINFSTTRSNPYDLLIHNTIP